MLYSSCIASAQVDPHVVGVITLVVGVDNAVVRAESTHMVVVVVVHETRMTTNVS